MHEAALPALVSVVVVSALGGLTDGLVSLADRCADGSTDWQSLAGVSNRLVHASAPMSGLFDIEPHRHSQLQAEIRLTAKEAKAMSPMYLAYFDASSEATVTVGSETQTAPIRMGEPCGYNFYSLFRPTKLYKIAPNTPPISGATQKSQSCASAGESAKSATPVDRAGFTDVFVTGIDTR